ncbi:MAG: TetR/AcrR family transcriptional regulator [Agathobacter sp.]|nr:TetR/AcrR family transcriptional regulator [Agathobacter sp.]
MYKICKTEKSIARQKLFQTTLLAMMKKNKFHDITVTSLAKEMGVPRKTFYRYYDSLEDVLDAIVDDALTEAFLNLEVKTDLVGFFSYWKKRKSLLDVLQKSGLSHLLINRIFERFNESIDKGNFTNEELRYSGYISAIMTMLLTWHHSGMKQSPEEMSQEVKHMFKIED